MINVFRKRCEQRNIHVRIIYSHAQMSLSTVIVVLRAERVMQGVRSVDNDARQI